MLFAIWAMNSKVNPEARYIGQIWLAVNYYSDLLNTETILIGDFNSNQIWDYKDRVGNHTSVVEYLKKGYGIYSLYHELNSVKHGQEKDPTFYMHRKKEKNYHIDYCFASEKILKNGYKMTLESVDNWIELSDHVPMIIETSGNLPLARLDNSLKDFIKNKFQNLLPETSDKFSELIADLIFHAKESDKFDTSIEHLKKRKQIIDKVEKLFEIDKMIREIHS